MINQVYTGTPTSRRFVALPPALANTTFAQAGQAILVGSEPCFTLDAYQSATGGCTCLFNGSFSWTVIATQGGSPVVNVQVNPGDTLYYTGGSYDAPTNVTYGGTLSKTVSVGSPAVSNLVFGHYDASQIAIPAGTTNTAAVVQI